MLERPRLAGALTGAFIAVAYCLLINRYWHFSADSALYLTLGRNLAEGRGYTFNGVPHSQVPGGWAYTLSLLLRVSRAFLWLNVVQVLMMLTALAVLYRALRIIFVPADALVVVLMTAFSLWIYEYAMALMSETPFFLCSNIAVLFLLKATRAPSRRARVVLTVGLCAAAAVAFVYRLVACFWLAPLAAALFLENRKERGFVERLVSAGAVCAVLIGCYFAYRHWGAGVLAARPAGPPGTTDPLTKAGQTGYSVLPFSMGWLRHNLRSLVFWPSWLLWPPSGMVQRMPIRRLASWLVWIPNIIVALGCYRAARRGQILLAASVLFFGPFLMWSSGGKPTTGRYAIAVVPFVMALFLLGLRQTGELLRDRAHIRLRPGVLVAFGTGAVMLPALLLFGVDAWVQRSPDYYARFRGGGYAGMMGSLKWLFDHDVAEPVASRDHSTFRVVACLTGYRVARMGSEVEPVAPGFEEAAREFAAETGVRWMLTMDKHRKRRWPIWHIPRQYLRGRPLPPDFWQIWHYDPETDELSRVPAEPLFRWPTELPPGRS
jgi:hypothetical protein